MANEFKHSPFKYVSAPCTTTYIVCDMLKKEEVKFTTLKYGSFRILQANEYYYQEYDKKGFKIFPDYSDPDTPYEYS